MWHDQHNLVATILHFVELVKNLYDLIRMFTHDLIHDTYTNSYEIGTL